MASYLRPRRGKKATAIAQLNSSAPLKRGEVFFEVPNGGTGTGAGRIKMGDGSTAYESLPYFLEPFDPNSATVGFTNATAAESDPYTTNATHTNAIVPSANLKTILTNLKQLLLNYNSQFTKLNNDLYDLNNSLPKIYNGEPNGEFVKDVKDCSFILYPNIKRVDFQFVGVIKTTIPDWYQVVKIPTNLQISKVNDSYCGTAITSDGKVGMCYISPSYNGYLVPNGISNAGVGEIVKLFGSYYIN